MENENGDSGRSGRRGRRNIYLSRDKTLTEIQAWETDLAVPDNERLAPGRGRLRGGDKYQTQLAQQRLLLRNKFRRPSPLAKHVIIRVPSGRPDSSAFTKWILDAMEESIYENDRQVEAHSVVRDPTVSKLLISVRDLDPFTLSRIFWSFDPQSSPGETLGNPREGGGEPPPNFSGDPE